MPKENVTGTNSMLTGCICSFAERNVTHFADGLCCLTSVVVLHLSDVPRDVTTAADNASPAGLPLLAGALTASATHSDEPLAPEPQQQQQQSTAVAAASPSSAAVDSYTDTQGRHLLRVMDGPSTNPEPLPEGLSPPRPNEDLNGLGAEDIADGAEAAAAGSVDPKVLLLPPELREPPAGEVHPHVQKEVGHRAIAKLLWFLSRIMPGRLEQLQTVQYTGCYLAVVAACLPAAVA